MNIISLVMEKIANISECQCLKWIIDRISSLAGV